MAWETVANFVALYMRRARPRKFSKASSAFSRTALLPERHAGPANGNRFSAARNSDTDFATHGRVVHVCDSESRGEKLVGVQFTGPRFQRVFRSESAA